MICMPNWCLNEVTVEGPKKDLKKFRDYFKKNDYCFSLNCVIEMPKSLAIPAGSEKQVAIIYALNKRFRGNILNADPKMIAKLDPSNMMGLLTARKQFRSDASLKFKKMVEKRKEEFSRYPKSGVPCKGIEPMGGLRTEEELYFYGKTLIQNKVKYGSEDWYEWCNANWGTKWDVDDEVEIEDMGDSLYFSFNTAWCPPIPVFYKLSTMFPTLTINVYTEGEDGESETLYFHDGY